MGIDFHTSPRPTLGVEVEAFLVDRETRALVNGADALLEEMVDDRADTAFPRAKNELMLCTVEAVTGISESVGEARSDLATTMTRLQAVAETRGWALACAGTHPFTHWRDLELCTDARYRRLVDEIGWPARRLATHGIHYHVGVSSADASVAIVNSLTHHLPLFLGLSASSPFWNGDDTRLASARTKIFEGLPTAGLPPHLEDWADFENYMDTLMSAGAVRTIREVWWDVRPHPDFGTVELRMCDGMTNLDDIAAVAALAQCLVSDLAERFDSGEQLPTAREWVLKENKWLAARHGLDAEVIVDDAGTRRPIRSLVEGLAERLGPTARRLGCTDELAAVATMARGPSSAERQRAAYARRGSLLDVVDLVVEEFDTPRALEEAPP